MRDLISFLTQIPVKGAVHLERVIAQSYLFPVIGALIGFVVALVAFLAFGLFGGVAPDLAALLTLLGLYLFTGLLHLDGLSDFFDGVMAPGSEEEKRRAMKDDRTGIAGLFATLMLLLLTLAAIKTVVLNLQSAAFDWHFSAYYHFAAVFVTAELAAKLSMNTCIFMGKGYEAPGGLGRLFILASSPRKYLIALFSALLLALIVTASIQCLTVLTGALVAGGVTHLAKWKFGAVSGDVIGASNELARCATLLVWALM
jgi:adenosylcobinamide-GDP ribazoletransferase